MHLASRFERKCLNRASGDAGKDLILAQGQFDHDAWAIAGAATASATKITARTANRRIMLILPKVGIP